MAVDWLVLFALVATACSQDYQRGNEAPPAAPAKTGFDYGLPDYGPKHTEFGPSAYDPSPSDPYRDNQRSGFDSLRPNLPPEKLAYRPPPARDPQPSRPAYGNQQPAYDTRGRQPAGYPPRQPEYKPPAGGYPPRQPNRPPRQPQPGYDQSGPGYVPERRDPPYGPPPQAGPPRPGRDGLFPKAEGAETSLFPTLGLLSNAGGKGPATKAAGGNGLYDKFSDRPRSSGYGDDRNILRPSSNILDNFGGSFPALGDPPAQLPPFKRPDPKVDQFGNPSPYIQNPYPPQPYDPKSKGQRGPPPRKPESQPAYGGPGPDPYQNQPNKHAPPNAPNPYGNNNPKAPNPYPYPGGTDPNPYQGQGPKAPNPYQGQGPKAPNPYQGQGPKAPNPYQGQGPKAPNPYQGQGPKAPNPYQGQGPNPYANQAAPAGGIKNQNLLPKQVPSAFSGKGPNSNNFFAFPQSPNPFPTNDLFGGNTGLGLFTAANKATAAKASAGAKQPSAGPQNYLPPQQPPKGYPPPQQPPKGYPPPQQPPKGYPPPQRPPQGYPPQNPGYPPAAGGYPPKQAGYPPQATNLPKQNQGLSLSSLYPSALPLKPANRYGVQNKNQGPGPGPANQGVPQFPPPGNYPPPANYPQGQGQYPPNVAHPGAPPQQGGYPPQLPPKAPVNPKQNFNYQPGQLPPQGTAPIKFPPRAPKVPAYGPSPKQQPAAYPPVSYNSAPVPRPKTYEGGSSNKYDDSNKHGNSNSYKNGNTYHAKDGDSDSNQGGYNTRDQYSDQNKAQNSYKNDKSGGSQKSHADQHSQSNANGYSRASKQSIPVTYGTSSVKSSAHDSGGNDGPPPIHALPGKTPAKASSKPASKASSADKFGSLKPKRPTTSDLGLDNLFSFPNRDRPGAGNLFKKSGFPSFTNTLSKDLKNFF